MKKIFIIFSVLLLVYLVLPGPSSVTNFPALPDSTKSTLSGDTWQVPNVSAYFSNNDREFATAYYKDIYKKQTMSFLPPIRLNYPPEFAYTTIKDQTESTYLEEFIYPLRNSIYINGMEPFEVDGQPKYFGATKFHTAAGFFETKVTLRFYPSPIWARIITWVGINLSVILIWKLGRKIIVNG